MNSVKSEKYKLSPEEIEKKKSLSSESCWTIFNMHRIEKSKLLCNRLNKHDEKIRGKKKNIKGKFEYCRESFGFSWKN